MQSKAKEFRKDIGLLAEYMKALSHPARLRILQFLTETNACMCGDIVEALPLSQSTVSQHLKMLKEAGLIQGTLEGPRTCYCVDYEVLNTVRHTFEEFFSGITKEMNAMRKE